MASHLASLIEGKVQQLSLDIYSLKARKSAHRSHINVYMDHTASLGPWPDAISESFIQNYRQEVRRPILAFRESATTFVNWQKHHKAIRMGSWPTPSEGELSWYKARKATDLNRWQAVGIA